MSPDDIKALRKELDATARELAAALDTDQETILAWERGELFPTKRLVDRMEALRRKGRAAFPRKKRPVAAAPPIQVLADPDFWRLVRKLVAHPELRAALTDLAAAYADPAD